MPERDRRGHEDCRVALNVRVAHLRTSFCMTLSTILLIVLVLLLIGAVPSWPHSRGWGYGPSGILGVILVLVVVLALMGRI